MKPNRRVTTEEARERLQKEQEEMKEVQKQRLSDVPHYSKTTEEIQAEIKEKYGKKDEEN